MPQMDPLGQLMNPMQPQARNPPVPNATMVAPQAPPQPQPTAPQQPPMPQQAPGVPPMPPQTIQSGMPPTGATPPMGAGPGSMIMPQRMPDIVQLLMSRMANTQPNGTQSAPLTGQPPTVGGR